VLSSQYHGVVDKSCMSIARSTFVPAVITSATVAEISGRFVPDSTDLSGQETDAIELALAEPTHSITQERKWRLLQMVMQCSMKSYDDRNTSPALQTSTVNRSAPASEIHDLVTELDRSMEQYFFPSLHYRLRLIELHVWFETQVRLEHERKLKEMAIRRREFAAGEKPAPLNQSGIRAKNIVLDMIINAGNSKLPSYGNLRKKINTFMKLGSVLHLLVCNLGLGILLALPSCTVYQHDLKLQSSTPVEHHRPLEPSE
jgi:hypothetical protein